MARSRGGAAFSDIARYIEAMTDLEPRLPANERADLERFYRTRAVGVRDSDWPGWERYLGKRPDLPRLRIVALPKGDAA